MLLLAQSDLQAYSMEEKESLIRLALNAPYTPWVSVFRVGASCKRGKVIAWFPCTLLVSAVPRSRRVAMEYKSWRPGTDPAFDRKEVRQLFANMSEQTEHGTWISRNSANINSTEQYLRDSEVVSGLNDDKDIQSLSNYFPPDATVPALQAARTLRAFYRTGRRASYFTWVSSPVNTTILTPNLSRRA